jgi:PAS domain S-box-containing protein
MFDPDGQCCGFRGVAQDITELKQAEEEVRQLNADLESKIEARTAELAASNMSLVAEIAERESAEKSLRESRNQHQLVTDAMPALISYVGRDQRWQFNNRAYETWFGYVPAELRGRHIRDGLGEAAYAAIRPHVERALSGETVRYEASVPFAHGGTRHIEAVYVPDIGQDGEVRGIFSLVTDITERKRMEEALRENEARFSAVIDNFPAAIFLRDLRGRYVLVNRQFDAWYGDMPHGARGKEARELFSDEIADIVAELDREVIDTLDTVEREVDVPFANGESRTMKATRFPILDDDGAIRAIGGIDTDITEHKRLERELVQSERLAVLGRLTATVSHELRNPLGTIKTSAAVVEAKARGKGLGIDRALDRVDRNITRCDRIIDELLDFARSRDLTTEPTPIDPWLNELLDEQAIPEGITVRRELTAPEATVALDRERYRRAVINVYENACQAITEATGDNGGQADGLVTFVTRVAEGRLEISIADDGPGIPNQVFDRIFEPLFSTRGFGVGLGLPTVKEIVEQHGGEVDIRTELGRGTEVLLCLPLYSESRGSEA